MRNRRRIQRKGPLIIYSKDEGLRKAFRNIPGVETMNVNRMNLLKLAPGGHVGRFVVWTESAFKKLNDLFGTWKTGSTLKKGYNLPKPIMSNTDLARLLKSEEIRKVLNPPKKIVHRHVRRLNPLRNARQLIKLNPYSEVTKRRALLLREKRRMERLVEKSKARGVVLPKNNPGVVYQKVEANRKKQLTKARAERKKRVAAKVLAVKQKRIAYKKRVVEFKKLRKEGKAKDTRAANLTKKAAAVPTPAKK